MDGLINLLKPTGITSAKALYRVRKITGVRKSGHAGTLDPGADGVLVLCLGKGTKLVERIMDQPKVYRATARLDVTSESFDSDSDLTAVDVEAVPSQEDVIRALASFEGCIQQVPPRISAVKLGGQPAYKRARTGEGLELAPRTVTIYWVFVHTYDWPTLDFELACGRGTYVRSVVRDLGAALSTGGCLTSLTRTAVGPFTSNEGWTFEGLEASGDPANYLIPLEGAIRLLDRRPIPIPPRPG
ncbi:MAG: tRNA pseudouridine(55) synthase TruB [Phycisphaerales bacterium]|nr:MAG: tRNA pseudouridine(55) synthase TruB [Phycisphaerales bacterium]